MLNKYNIGARFILNTFMLSFKIWTIGGHAVAYADGEDICRGGCTAQEGNDRLYVCMYVCKCNINILIYLFITHYNSCSFFYAYTTINFFRYVCMYVCMLVYIISRCIHFLACV